MVLQNDFIVASSCFIRNVFNNTVADGCNYHYDVIEFSWIYPDTIFGRFASFYLDSIPSITICALIFVILHTATFLCIRRKTKVNGTRIVPLIYGVAIAPSPLWVVAQELGRRTRWIEQAINKELQETTI